MDKNVSVAQKLISLAHKIHQPLFTTIELTQNCNLTCKHCYNFDRTQQVTAPKGSLSTLQIKDLIVDLRALGTLWLNLSGGEPLLHKDIVDIVSFAKSQHLLTRIKTNGILLTQEMIERLKSAGLDALDISLYGNNEEAYQALTGKNGAGKTKAAILLAKKYEISCSVNIILTKTNIAQLDEMIQWCEDNALTYQLAEEITARYDGTNSSRELEVSSDQMRELLAGKHSNRFMYKNHEQSLQCSCAKTVLGIGHDGNVYPCIGAPIKAGSILEQDISIIWKDAEVFKKIRNLTKQDFKSCSSCDYIDTCNRSSGAIYANTGDYCGCEPKTLEFARLRHLKNRT